MNYKIEDKAGNLLAEGRIQRNRAEALATVAKIERRMAMEKLILEIGRPRTQMRELRS